MIELDRDAGRAGGEVALIARAIADQIVADHGLELAVGVHPPHAVVLPVEDVKAAVGRDVDVDRPVERRAGRHAAVAVEGGLAVAGDGADGAGGIAGGSGLLLLATRDQHADAQRKHTAAAHPAATVLVCTNHDAPALQ